MDSDSDQSDVEINKIGFPRANSHPYLLLFGKEEATAKAFADRMRRDAAQEDLGPNGLIFQEDIKFYHTLRFFHSIQGFYKGSLDLTGRHLPRFLELQTQWNSYIADFLEVTIDVKRITSDERDSDSFPFTDFKFKHKSAWNTFQKQWKVSPRFNYGTLLLETRKVLATIVEHNTPQIQRLCLVDLPPEILDHIFRETDLADARLLSSTCHCLNRVGQRYIFNKRSLVFSPPRSLWKELSSMSKVEAAKNLKKMAISSRDHVASMACFLLSRPDLTDKLWHLTLADQWDVMKFSRYLDAGFNASIFDKEFRVPIHRSFTDVLVSSANITTLELHRLILPLKIIRGIRDLQHLHTLQLVDCDFTQHAQSLLRTDPGQLVFNSVYNLQLVFVEGTRTLWDAVLLCPNIRTFSAQDIYDDMVPPPTYLINGPSSFATLEHIYLEGLAFGDVMDHVLWLSSGPDLDRLTHFKVHAHAGMSDHHIHLLLDTLTRKRSPLRVLALEGLAEAQFGLFDEIAHRFPNLTGLRLIRRESTRQFKNRPVVWPHATWEYASHLQGLSQLQHFEWNCHESCPASSALLVRFEEGFYDEKADVDTWAETKDDYDFDEDQWTPVVFATYCPSLRTYGTSELMMYLWCIHRMSHGAIVARRLPKEYISSRDRWDPPPYTGHWTYVLPGETGVERLEG